jgi:hypothetical protein
MSLSSVWKSKPNKKLEESVQPTSAVYGVTEICSSETSGPLRTTCRHIAEDITIHISDLTFVHLVLQPCECRLPLCLIILQVRLQEMGI